MKKFIKIFYKIASALCILNVVLSIAVIIIDSIKFSGLITMLKIWISNGISGLIFLILAIIFWKLGE